MKTDWFKLLKHKYPDFAELVSSPIVAIQVKYDIIMGQLEWLKFYLNEEIDCDGVPQTLDQIKDEIILYEAKNFLKRNPNHEDTKFYLKNVTEGFHQSLKNLGLPPGIVEVSLTATTHLNIEEYIMELKKFYTFESFCERKNFADSLYKAVIRKYIEK